MSQPAQTSTALLEELRQRIRSEYAPPPPSPSERLATFGRGVLSNRGSLLDNLTAGVAAQEQAAAARAEQQRRALDMERQVVENAIREETERNRLAQNQAQFEAEAPYREARTGLTRDQAAQARAMADFYARDRGAGGRLRGQITPERYTQIFNQADAEARQRYRDPTPGMPETPTQAAERQRLREEYRNTRIQQILEGAAQIQAGQTPTPGATTPPAPVAPRITVGAGGGRPPQ